MHILMSNFAEVSTLILCMQDTNGVLMTLFNWPNKYHPKVLSHLAAMCTMLTEMQGWLRLGGSES